MTSFLTKVLECCSQLSALVASAIWGRYATQLPSDEEVAQSSCILGCNLLYGCAMHYHVSTTVKLKVRCVLLQLAK